MNNKERRVNALGEGFILAVIVCTLLICMEKGAFDYLRAESGTQNNLPCISYYDEEDKLRKLVFTDEDGEPVVYDGMDYHTVEYLYDREGRREEEIRTGGKYTEHIRNDGAENVYYGYFTNRLGFKVVNKERGYHGIRYTEDDEGRVVLQQYFDKKGRPMEVTGGWHSVRFAYRPDGICQAITYWFSEGMEHSEWDESGQTIRYHTEDAQGNVLASWYLAKIVDRVNVRSGPGAEYSQKDSLEGGEIIVVHETARDEDGATWKRIQYEGIDNYAIVDDGAQNWIAARFCEPLYQVKMEGE